MYVRQLLLETRRLIFLLTNFPLHRVAASLVLPSVAFPPQGRWAYTCSCYCKQVKTHKD